MLNHDLTYTTDADMRVLDSVCVAASLGVQHPHILATIHRKMVEIRSVFMLDNGYDEDDSCEFEDDLDDVYEKFFVESKYRDGYGRSQRRFLLTPAGYMLIAGAMTGLKATKAQLAFALKYRESINDSVNMSTNPRKVGFWRRRCAELEKNLRDLELDVLVAAKIGASEFDAVANRVEDKYDRPHHEPVASRL